MIRTLCLLSAIKVSFEKNTKFHWSQQEKRSIRPSLRLTESNLEKEKKLDRFSTFP